MNKTLKGGIERIVTTVIIAGLVITAVISAVINISSGGTGLTQGVVESLPKGDPKITITN